MSEEAQAGGAAGERRELRLGLVCYAGVSLCIYMHGATKELERLVRASRRLADGSCANGRAPTASERVYRELLEEVASRDGARTDVVVDVIAGTSAGGINGIFLAKALAHDLSQDTLREVWLDKGDINKLVRGPQFVPFQVRLAALLALGAPPLRGREMALWLYGALCGMDRGPAPDDRRTLMPEGQSLHLFVTATDFYGYDRQVAITDPRIVHDRRHRHLLEFRYGSGEDMFTPAGNLGLAFAARATSSMPGAFPPVSIPRFKSQVRDGGGELPEELFRVYGLSGRSADHAYFVDGAVLDDRPFGYAIDAIRQKQADVEVDRRLLYLEPDPARPTPPPPGKPPGLLSTVLGAAAGIGSREPILDGLLEVGRLNQRVERTQDVIRSSFDDVAVKVREVVGDALVADEMPDPEELGRWQERLNEVSRMDAGTAYATYVRTRIASVVDRLAAVTSCALHYPHDTNHAALVRSVFRFWAHEHGLFENVLPPSDAQRAVLRVDVDFRIRRLQFLVAGLNWCYQQGPGRECPPRADLDLAKERLSSAICGLKDATSGRTFGDDIRDELLACFPTDGMTGFLQEEGLDGAAYGRARRAELEGLVSALRASFASCLDGFSIAVYRDLVRVAAGWDRDFRLSLLVRYLGFPFWDVLLYPVQSAALAGEQDAVDVVRLSPFDAKLLRVPPGRRKLEGTGLAHFRAFFKRSYRENDYLWGRLDAAERLIYLVLGEKGPEHKAWCRRVFVAILDEEEPALQQVAPLISDLRGQAAAL